MSSSLSAGIERLAIIFARIVALKLELVGSSRDGEDLFGDLM